MPDNVDTIVAIATPAGRGGIGIVRVSGPAVSAIAEHMLKRVPAPRCAVFTVFLGAGDEVLDHGLALYFPKPHSFTGEDVLELHGHGGTVVMDRLLQQVTSLGARLARPGEFSERAFLNDKLDLAQAEAVADLIDSSSVQAARAAVRTLRGEFSQHIHVLVHALTEVRLHVEAAMDFPEEEIDVLSDGKIAARIAELSAQIAAVQRTAQHGALLREGITVVIAGRPNVGKSSLLNRLAGYDAAIVTAIAGTTRDLVREHIHLDGLPLHLIDTAGLRDSADIVEQEGIRRAWNEVANADHVLLVIDDCTGMEAPEYAILSRLPQQAAVTVLHNKIDLSGSPPAVWQDDDGRAHVRFSAKTGAGFDLFVNHLHACHGYQPEEAAGFLARRRHLDALLRAQTYLDAASAQVCNRQAELIAEELRLAQEALGEITGAVSSDDLLGRIFSAFCIGK